MGLSVLGLWRYPVKSMQGEAVETLELTPDGPVGDRLFAIRDPAGGLILTGRKAPELLLATARMEAGEVRIELPEGRVTGSLDPEVDAVLSSWLGRPVELKRNQGVGADFEVPVAPEVAPAYGLEPGSTLVATTPATAFTDVAHLHIVLAGRLESMRARFGEGWAARRFRPNLLLGGSVDGAGESELPGRGLRIDDARLLVTEGSVRCVMLTRPLDGLPDAVGILQTLAAESGVRFGVYAQVVAPAPIRVGAAVDLDGPQ